MKATQSSTNIDLRIIYRLKAAISLLCGVFVYLKLIKGVRGVKSETTLGAFWKAEGGSVVGLVASAVRLRWLGVTGVWCICECKIDKGGERGRFRDDFGGFLGS